MYFNYTVFNTEHNKYLYDGTSCNIFEINDKILQKHKHLFEKLSDGSYKNDIEYKAQYDEILGVVDCGYLLPKQSKEYEYWFDTKAYKQELPQGMRHLMIGMTEKCNMRCKYCVYGGHYTNERIHSLKSIDNTVLIKSIDYFLENSSSPQKVVNFYGGEPFIEFSKIKKAVRYVQSKHPETLFYITTNGTLLSDCVAQWFSENNTVHLYVSIAGTPSMHDELRVLVDGSPTFQTIKDNLERMKALDPVAYSNRMHIVFNIFDELQLEELQTFYESERIFRNIKNDPEITFIDCAEDDGAVQALYKKVMMCYTQEQAPLQKYIALLKEGNRNNLIVKHYDKKLLPIHRRLLNDDRNTLSGVCRPFINKMFVDTYGNVNVCENFTFGNTFGTVNDSFDEEKVDILLSRYKECRSQMCNSCWALKICSLCYRDLFDRNAQIDMQRAYQLCEYERTQKQQTLIEYCTVLEAGANLLDHLNEYVLFA